MKSFVSFLSEAYSRIKAQTPPFFEKLGAFFTWITAVSAVITPQFQAISDFCIGYHIAAPTWLAHLATYSALMGLVGRMVTSLPKVDKKSTSTS